MQTDRITLPRDGSSRWAGMANLLLTSPDGQHLLNLRYAGEPPHGDSIHEGSLDGVPLPGLFWGCNFAFSSNSRYFAASWMERRFERQTIVVDALQLRYFVLPHHIHDFTFKWPLLEGATTALGLEYLFDGSEKWTSL